ncbi:MAG: S1/P1 nuclease [Ferruginibacter sp.]
MIVKSIKRTLIVTLFFYFPAQAGAWGLLGHRIVGQIADSYLTKHTKKEIAKILGDESIAMASNWPDFIKSDPAYSYLSPWHYLDFSAGQTADQIQSFLAKDTAVDAYTKINFLVGELKNKSLEKNKQVMYLRLLIHIVGDIHQPLHCGRREDQGGNKIKVTWFNSSYNLHQIWDQQLINYQQLSYTEYATAINHTTKDQVKELQSQPLSQWIIASYQTAEKIYNDIKPDDKLDYLYNFKYLDTLNQQLLMGGVHLAGLLNEIFG